LISTLDRFWTWLTEADAPVPGDDWHDWLHRDLAFYRALTPDDRRGLRECMAHFLDRVPIEGAGGFVVDEEVRLTLAATACRLVLHLDVRAYDALTAVYVYPHEVLVHPTSGQHLLGAAYHHGAVVLSWPAVVRGLSDPDDGRDTGLHEFAHSLDFGSGHANGAPVLRARDHYRAWGSVLETYFEGMQQGRPVLRPYAATNPAEFFACATEAFFEQPRRLKRVAPELYVELARYYGWEPPQVR
jgi:Mlc titration factor MtfA (ptsG expression regulator)